MCSISTNEVECFLFHVSCILSCHNSNLFLNLEGRGPTAESPADKKNSCMHSWFQYINHIFTQECLLYGFNLSTISTIFLHRSACCRVVVGGCGNPLACKVAKLFLSYLSLSHYHLTSIPFLQTF